MSKVKLQTYNPTTEFITPPENQGQFVTLSYALDCDAEVILVSSYDAGDHSKVYYAYMYPDNDDGSWEPQNCVPELGEYLGECQIEYDS